MKKINLMTDIALVAKISSTEGGTYWIPVDGQNNPYILANLLNYYTTDELVDILFNEKPGFIEDSRIYYNENYYLDDYNIAVESNDYEYSNSYNGKDLLDYPDSGTATEFLIGQYKDYGISSYVGLGSKDDDEVTEVCDDNPMGINRDIDIKNTEVWFDATDEEDDEVHYIGNIEFKDYRKDKDLPNKNKFKEFVTLLQERLAEFVKEYWGEDVGYSEEDSFTKDLDADLDIDALDFGLDDEVLEAKPKKVKNKSKNKAKNSFDSIFNFDTTSTIPGFELVGKKLNILGYSYLSKKQVVKLNPNENTYYRYDTDLNQLVNDTTVTMDMPFPAVIVPEEFSNLAVGDMVSYEGTIGFVIKKTKSEYTVLDYKGTTHSLVPVKNSILGDNVYIPKVKDFMSEFTNGTQINPLLLGMIGNDDNLSNLLPIMILGNMGVGGLSMGNAPIEQSKEETKTKAKKANTTKAKAKTKKAKKDEE